jgi:mannose-6-phosphate isomerase
MLPLRFRPLLRHTIWGGRRLGTVLHKPIGSGDDYGESWEVADLPGWESVVESGPLAGTSIRELMQSHRQELLGRHADRDRFPLLVKFIDGERDLSIQVHPRGEREGQREKGAEGTGGQHGAMTNPQSPMTNEAREYLSWSDPLPSSPLPPVSPSPRPPAAGKAEFWVVLEARPGSRMYLGLKPGVEEQDLRAALKSGTVAECMHTYAPQPGDCFDLKPGLLHALGNGILIAEIQQPSDVTYRLYDWDRVDEQGERRELHTEQALATIDYSLGPVSALEPTYVTAQAFPERLVESEYFIVQRYRHPGSDAIPDDDRLHVLSVLAGQVRGIGPARFTLGKGETIVLPADRDEWRLEVPADAIVLDAFLP